MNELLRQFIVLAIEVPPPRPDGAGIILFRESHDKIPRILLLVKEDGKYDLPKGHMEYGETPLQTALRETREESGVSKVEFPWGCEGRLTTTCMFFVGTTRDVPSIVMNKESCKFEHRSAVWLPPEDVLMGIDRWMKPAIEWALSRAGCYVQEEPQQDDPPNARPYPLRTGSGYTW